MISELKRVPIPRRAFGLSMPDQETVARQWGMMFLPPKTRGILSVMISSIMTHLKRPKERTSEIWKVDDYTGQHLNIEQMLDASKNLDVLVH